MSSHNTAELLALALRIGKETGQMLMDRPAELQVNTKSTAIDVVTQMDIEVEAYIVKELLAARPNDGLIGEEGAERASASGILSKFFSYFVAYFFNDIFFFRFI